MELKEAARIAMDCGVLYHNLLFNNTLMFVYGSLDNKSYIEVEFLPQNYQYLTGLIYNRGSALTFYYDCVDQRLSPLNISFSSESTAQKLSVLPQLMNIHHTANMIGDYDKSRVYLDIEMLAGTVYACMGLDISTDRIGYYYPKTTLREDIRDITNRW